MPKGEVAYMYELIVLLMVFVSSDPDLQSLCLGSELLDQLLCEVGNFLDLSAGQETLAIRKIHWDASWTGSVTHLNFKLGEKAGFRRFVMVLCNR